MYKFETARCNAALEFVHLRAPKGRPISAQANGLGQQRSSVAASPVGRATRQSHT